MYVVGTHLNCIDNILIFFAEKCELLTFFQPKITAYLHIT